MIFNFYYNPELWTTRKQTKAFVVRNRDNDTKRVFALEYNYFIFTGMADREL